MAQRVVGYDLTLDAKACTVSELQVWLHGWAKKYVFQLEKGEETGYEHYQVRLHLIKKRRLTEIIAATKGFWGDYSRHWSVTSATVHEGANFNYVLKADTRVCGPWKDSEYEEPPVLTRQLREFMEFEFRPWQDQVFNMVKELDNRSIKLIYDKKGNSGKSIFAEYLEYNRLAYELPPMRFMEDIMQCVMSVKSQKAYLVDMPRAMKKDKLADFYSGLEALKNGVCYDKRYSFKKRRMDRPQIVVFTNTLPSWDCMSPDRWEVWDLNDQRLTPHEIPALAHEKEW